jgi:PilZ domain
MATGATSNARRLDRIPTNSPVTLQFESQGESHHQRARLLDISDTGMRLKTGVALAKGQQVEVASQHGMQEPEQTRVVWVQEVESEQAYLVGVEILNPHAMNPTAMPSELVSRPAKGVAGGEDETRKVVGDDRGPMGR